MKGSLAVKINLNTILRDTILLWYITKLFDLEKFNLRIDNNIEEWCKILLRRFKEFIEITFAHFIAKKYIFADARNRRESFEYIQAIIYYVKFINIDNVENQLIFIYQNIVAELRVFVDSFSVTILISSFI